MQPIKKLASEAAVYGLSSVLGRVLNYLLVPFYTSVLLPAEYGVVTEWYAYAAFLQILYTYGMETAYFRFAAQDRQYFHAACTLLFVTSLIFSGLLALLATPLVRWLGQPGSECFVYYLAAILAVDTVLAIPFAQLRLQKRALRFASIKLLQIGLHVVLNIGLLSYDVFLPAWAVTTQRVAYIFLANLVANAAVLPFFTSALRSFQPQLTWQHLSPMLSYAWPLLIMGLAVTANEMLSRAALRHWLPTDFYPESSEAVLGIFGACYKLSIFMALGTQAFRYAAEPFFFTHGQERHAPALLSALMHGFIIAACFVLFAISVNLDLIGLLLLRNAEYRLALPIVPYLLLAYLFGGVYYNLSAWFKLTDKTHYGVWLAGLGAVVTIVLNAVLIPQLGYWGSVWATLASHITMVSVSYYLGQKYYPIPYKLGRGLTYILGTMGLVLLVRHVAYANFARGVVANAVLTLVFGIALWGLGRRDLMQYKEL